MTVARPRPDAVSDSSFWVRDLLERVDVQRLLSNQLLQPGVLGPADDLFRGVSAPLRHGGAFRPRGRSGSHITRTRSAGSRQVRKLDRALATWREKILAWHRTRASNAATEAINNVAKRVKRVALGFVN